MDQISVSGLVLLTLLSIVIAALVVGMIAFFDNRTRPKTSASRQLVNIGAANEVFLAPDDAVSASPFPTWRTSSDGTVVWCNAAYQKLIDATAVEAMQDETEIPIALAANSDIKSPENQRLSLVGVSPDKAEWFDVYSTVSGDGAMHFANNIDPVIKAEISQRNFVQTLAKTFAHLSTGLAIFDRNRQLALFNPALIDLTALPADFLSAKPNLLSFFDRLREGRIMPEPKNYSGWRERIADVVSAASDGRFQETWTLPSGLTYHVSGRPHPDGAVAFLFEDVTAEVTLTQRFRAQLDLSQSVIDQLEDAIAVFSPLGVLSLTNAAFNSLWGLDLQNSFADVSLLDVSRIWREKCVASPVWQEMDDYVNTYSAREIWATKVELRCGTVLECRFDPLPNSATLVTFKHITKDARTPQLA